MFNFRAVRDIARMKDIILVLLKYGFDDLVNRLPIGREFLGRHFTRIQEDLTAPERVRRVLEELGTTFIKFGQVASVRPDLIPESYVLELIKLQDSVPPVDFSLIRQQIVLDLGRNVEELFSFIDSTPLASASVAQIHRAVLKKNGQGVAVKVRRPKIEAVVRADLEIMDILARTLHQMSNEIKVVNLPGLVAEFKITMNREMDFRREALNMKIFDRKSKGRADVFVPRVYDEYCGKRVLTLEYVAGVTVNGFEGTEEQRKALAEIGIRSVFRQIFEYGFFHGDPHPGNVMVVDAERLCFLDWGIVGRITATERERILEVIEAFADADEETLIQAWLKLVDDEFADYPSTLERGVLEILDSFFLVEERKRSVGRFMLDLMDLFRKHRIATPPQLAHMSIALLEGEGTARRLYADLNIVEMLKPMVAAIKISHLNPFRKSGRVLKLSKGAFLDLAAFPRRAVKLLAKLQTGKFSMNLEHKGLANLTHIIDETANKLAFAIIIGSLIIGSSMILVAEIKPLAFGYSLLGIIGYLFSAILGVWMVIDIFRSRRF